VTAALALIGRIQAFIVRDFQLAMSYRFDFVVRMVWVVLTTSVLYFMSHVFPLEIGTSNGQWGNPFFAWLTGVPILTYFMVGFSSLANAIRSEQAQGTLEGVMMTPINLPTLIVASSAWEFVQATIQSCLYFFCGWAIFGLQYRGTFGAALVFLLLTTLVLASIGILSASFAIVFKRGDPLALLLGTSSAFLSGALFPIEVVSKKLGPFIDIVAALIPTTYGIDGIRRVLIQGQTLSEASRPLFALLIFLAVLLPTSLWLFSLAVRRAKREGSLIQY
jgi:ABC-2 type transport system permease protein